MGIAEAVRQLREQRRLTKAELAARCGLAPSYLSRLESGDYKSPTVSTLVTIADGLDVDPRELLVLAGYVPEDLARTRRHLAEESIARVAESAIRSISQTASASLTPGGIDAVNGTLNVDSALLAERLRDFRRANGPTIREVARRAGVRPALVSALEAGKRPSGAVDVMAVLNTGYGMSESQVDDLMFEVSLSHYLADDLVLSAESRRMTLDFVRLARLRDRQSRQDQPPPQLTPAPLAGCPRSRHNPCHPAERLQFGVHPVRRPHACRPASEQVATWT